MTSPPTEKLAPSTAERILDVAQRLAQTRGYNGFSYADIAAEIGVTKASLHYHFPSKGALGLALVERYTLRFAAALSEIDSGSEPAPAKVRRYTQLYQDVLVTDRLCLCAMFAAEIATLPPPVQEAVRAFFEVNERWVERVFAAGRADGSLLFAGESREAARAFAASLDGSMLIARSFGDESRFTAVTEHLLAGLTPRE